MGIFSSLSREQKEAVGILQIGTFLEYFDLMLYVHMAVVLNELFFPQTDPHTSRLIAASGFCATFIFRPFGALIFGYIGDTMGRKPTVIITTIMMALSCIVIATLPTYAQIGITASWVLTICRIVQGMSSMGEIIGAEIYLTELVKPPIRYTVVGLMDCASSFGTLMALAVATAVFAIKMDWRIAFWIGTLVALIGTVARTALRETPDFINAKHNINDNVETIPQHTLTKKTLLAYFLVQCGSPLCFYFTYIHCGSILKNLFHYTPANIIYHNLIVTIIAFFWLIFITLLSYRIYPLKIVKITVAISSIVILCIPYLLSNISLPIHLLLIQLFTGALGIYISPAQAVFFNHFPILKRFTCAGFVYALSRALMYIITSFGLVWMTEKHGNLGLLFIFVPVIIGFWFGLLHFEGLEKSTGHYPNQKLPNHSTTNIAAELPI